MRKTTVEIACDNCKKPIVVPTDEESIPRRENEGECWTMNDDQDACSVECLLALIAKRLKTTRDSIVKDMKPKKGSWIRKNGEANVYIRYGIVRSEQ